MLEYLESYMLFIFVHAVMGVQIQKLLTAERYLGGYDIASMPEDPTCAIY